MNHEEKIKDLEERVSKLEAIIQGVPKSTFSQKTLTLPELVKGKDVKNGQQRVALIVGYYEQFKQRNSVSVDDIREGWRDGKFDKTYESVFLQRAIKEGLVRKVGEGAFDLSQTGITFFEGILNGSKQ